MASSKTVKPFPPLIECRNITLAHGNRIVLDHINLNIEARENVAILGPNGAGKSTLIKTITREYYPLADNDSYIRLLGKDSWDVFRLRSQLGIVANDVVKNVNHLTCREMILSGFFNSTGLWHHHVTRVMAKRADEVMKLLGISELNDRQFGKLSNGESRLVLIGRALVNDPPTLLLDEPTLSLDAKAAWGLRRKLSEMIKLGKNIIVVTHDLSDIIPEVERVILIQDGKIIFDGKKSRALTSKSISQLFGMDLQVFRRNNSYYMG